MVVSALPVTDQEPLFIFMLSFTLMQLSRILDSLFLNFPYA